MSEKIYRVQMNANGMPNFSTAVEVADRPSIDKEYLTKLIQEAVYDGEACARQLDLVDRPQEWIPCKERLPARQGYYICTCKDGSRVLKTTTIKWSNGWQLSGTRTYWKVIAWMPLPEPYKEEADDEEVR